MFPARGYRRHPISRYPFWSGGLSGLFLGLLLLAAGVPSFSLSVSSFSLMLILSLIMSIYLAVLRWPPRGYYFDLYDLHRLIIGGFLGCGVVGILIDSSLYISTAISVPLPLGLTLVVLAFASYLVFGLLAVHLVRQRLQKQNQP